MPFVVYRSGQDGRAAMSDCEQCTYYYYDEEYEDYLCSADIDEDDYARMMQEAPYHRTRCPYWVNADEYAVVKHQAF